MSRAIRIDKKIAAILNMRELEILAEELRKLDFPTAETAEVGASPHRSPSLRSGAIAQTWPRDQTESF